MALGFQARASQRALSRMGLGALLRGVTAGNVHVAHNVALFPGIGDTADDNPMVRYTVACIGNQYLPKVGNILVHPDGTFVLDRLVEDNGYNSRFIVAASSGSP